jgi:Tfp pilus assembly protein PilP
MNRYSLVGLAVALGFWLPTPVGAEAPPPGLESSKDDAIKSILDQELEPAPGAYTYNPQGRRDPFVSLIKGPAEKTIRKQGMEGFLIQEVALKGLLRTSGGGEGVAGKAGYIAIFLGTDGKSYFVNVGQRLFDGQIIAIDGASVTFRQEITDPLSPVKAREIKQSLHESEEARQ